MECPWAIQTEGLTRRFGARTAVDNLSLHIPRGTVFGFLGPNGAGKTTTVRLLLGLLQPDAGWAKIMGLPVGPQARRLTGVLLDRDGLYDGLSAWDNLDFYGAIHHIAPAERRRRSEELLRFSELWERRDELVGGWSKGMRQKLALARALLADPSLLILDEPTTGLDPASLKVVRDLIVSLAADRQRTIFLCTHNLVEVERTCNLVGVIRSGRLLLQEDPQTLRARMSRPQVVVSTGGLSEPALEAVRGLPVVQDLVRNGEDLTVTLCEPEASEALVATLVAHGTGIREVRRATRSLEDIYLELMQEAG
jgi:ABC-2 type transport system ATP-binding protein